MMKNVLYSIALASASLAAQAAPISDLHNTGTGLTKGSKDHNYTVTDSSGHTTNGYATDTTNGYPLGSWIADNSTSAWDSNGPDASSSYPVANYDWKTTFDLTGFDPAASSFNGRFAADNSAVAYLNGHDIGTSGDYGSWSNFSSMSSFFVSGLNTVEFNVHNAGGPTGLRVEFTNSSETTPVTPAVPEPETYALLLAGLGALGFVARRRKSL